jgi:hypothetical protein
MSPFTQGPYFNWPIPMATSCCAGSLTELFNHLKPTGYVRHQHSTILRSVHAVLCIYLRTNSDLCHLQHKLIGFYNRYDKCLLHGTDWVFKYSSLHVVFNGLNPTCSTERITCQRERKYHCSIACFSTIYSGYTLHNIRRVVNSDKSFLMRLFQTKQRTNTWKDLEYEV